MARRIFFSFHYDRDIFAVQQIRHSWVVRNSGEAQPFVDKAEFEQIKRQGDRAVQNWIDTQMKGTSVTVVLIDVETYNRPWVMYEIEQSHRQGKGIIGIELRGMKNQQGIIDNTIAPNPFNYANIKNPSEFRVTYPIYNWVDDGGYENIARWIEKEASRRSPFNIP